MDLCEASGQCRHVHACGLHGRFRREAALAARIRSPHVAQVFDHGKTDEEIPYIVMELLHGETLEERLARAGDLSVNDTVLLVTQLCEALTRAHDLGVVHRDIKPSNVMLIESGYELFAKLLDFGIAKEDDYTLADELTRVGEVMGSPLYTCRSGRKAVRSGEIRSQSSPRLVER